MKFWVGLFVAAAFLVPAVEVQAQDSGKAAGYSSSGKPARGKGGYSYTPSDTINTYGNSRSNYGTTNSYRDTMADRQTKFGPFDHGFFFDSGLAPRGGNSPYMN